MAFCARAGSRSHGVLTLKPNSSPSAASTPPKYPRPGAPDHGATAPLASVFVGSGTMSSGSASSLVPRPVQVGQAPYGELNENDLGSSSSIDRGWSLGQASRSE